MRPRFGHQLHGHGQSVRRLRRRRRLLRPATGDAGVARVVVNLQSSLIEHGRPSHARSPCAEQQRHVCAQNGAYLAHADMDGGNPHLRRRVARGRQLRVGSEMFTQARRPVRRLRVSAGEHGVPGRLHEEVDDLRRLHGYAELFCLQLRRRQFQVWWQCEVLLGLLWIRDPLHVGVWMRHSRRRRQHLHWPLGGLLTRPVGHLPRIRPRTDRHRHAHWGGNGLLHVR